MLDFMLHLPRLRGGAIRCFTSGSKMSAGLVGGGHLKAQLSQFYLPVVCLFVCLSKLSSLARQGAAVCWNTLMRASGCGGWGQEFAKFEGVKTNKLLAAQRKEFT